MCHCHSRTSTAAYTSQPYLHTIHFLAKWRIGKLHRPQSFSKVSQHCPEENLNQSLQIIALHCIPYCLHELQFATKYLSITSAMRSTVISTTTMAMIMIMTLTLATTFTKYLIFAIRPLHHLTLFIILAIRHSQFSSFNHFIIPNRHDLIINSMYHLHAGNILKQFFWPTINTYLAIFEYF